MHPPKIFTAQEEQRASVIHTIMLGFISDPLVRWFCPSAAAYLKSGPLFDAFGGAAIESGAAFISENYEAAALWMPPGVESDEERLITVLQALAPSDILEEVFKVFTAMEAYHPKEACWYLPLVAVDPFYQGRGFGSHLMKHALTKVDAAGLPAYLESSNPRNISLYERHGFETMGQIQIGSSPVVTPMIRPTANQ